MPRGMVAPPLLEGHSGNGWLSRPRRPARTLAVSFSDSLFSEVPLCRAAASQQHLHCMLEEAMAHNVTRTSFVLYLTTGDALIIRMGFELRQVLCD